jgi:hypothetical protein
MAHCPFDELRDLRDVLDAIRTWPGVREPRPGVFYVKRTPFLHFHLDRSGRRSADARDGASWGAELEIERGAGASAKERFLREVERRYRRTASASKPR